MAETIAAWLRTPGQRWRLVAEGPEAAVRAALEEAKRGMARVDSLLTQVGVNPNERQARRPTPTHPDEFAPRTDR